MTEYRFITEDGEEATVKFGITENVADQSGKVYGISAELNVANIVENAEAKNRFYTYEEARLTIDMLCRHQVTPCTLCDVI